MKKLLITTAAVLAGVMLFSSNSYAGPAKTTTYVVDNSSANAYTDKQVNHLRYAGWVASKVISGELSPDAAEARLNQLVKEGSVEAKDAQYIQEQLVAFRRDYEAKGNKLQQLADLVNGADGEQGLRDIVTALNDDVNGEGGLFDQMDTLADRVDNLEGKIGTWNADKHAQPTIAGQVNANEQDIKGLKTTTNGLTADVNNLKDQIGDVNVSDLSDDVAENTDAINGIKDTVYGQNGNGGLVKDVANNTNAINGLNGRVGANEDNIASLQDTVYGQNGNGGLVQNVADNTGAINGLNNSVGALNDTVYGQNGNGGLVADVNSLKDQIGDTDVAGLADSVGTWDKTQNGGKTIAQQVSANKDQLASIGTWDKTQNGGKTMAQQVSANVDNIRVLADTALDHEDRISTNTANIATNAANIRKNAEDIQTVAGVVVDHENRISTNAANIAKVEQDYKAADATIVQEIAKVEQDYKEADRRITVAYQAADEAIKQGVFIAEGIDKLEAKVSGMDKQMKSSFAAGAAMAALVPNARAEGNTHLAAGTGYYDGKLGAAIGLFHYIDDNVLLNAGLAYAGNDSFTAKGGVTVGF